jgi:hypothetical protein
MTASVRPSLLWLCLPAFTLACASAQDTMSPLDIEGSDSYERDLASPEMTESSNVPTDADSLSSLDPSQDEVTEYNCTISVGLTTIDRNRTDDQGFDSEFCDDATGEQTRLVASGADAYLLVDGGRPHGANANCSDENSVKSASTMSVALEVVKKEGLCPPIEHIDLEVPVAVFGIIESEAHIRTHLATPSTIEQWEDVAYQNMAGGQVSISGTDIDTAVSNLSLTVGTDCEDADLSDMTSRNDDVVIRTSSQAVCGKAAVEAEAIVHTKARTEGQTFLMLGTNGRTMTKLSANTAYSATATSTTCTAGANGPDCIEVSSAAQVQTLNYCLEVSTQDVCNLASDTPGVDCIVDTRNAVIQVGNCD